MAKEAEESTGSRTNSIEFCANWQLDELLTDRYPLFRVKWGDEDRKFFTIDSNAIVRTDSS